MWVVKMKRYLLVRNSCLGDLHHIRCQPLLKEVQLGVVKSSRTDKVHCAERNTHDALQLPSLAAQRFLVLNAVNHGELIGDAKYRELRLQSTNKPALAPHHSWRTVCSQTIVQRVRPLLREQKEKRVLE